MIIFLGDRLVVGFSVIVVVGVVVVVVVVVLVVLEDVDLVVGKFAGAIKITHARQFSIN